MAKKKGTYCTKTCESLKRGEHYLYHLDHALELNGPKLTREQAVSQLMGLCGGGILTPSEYFEAVRKATAWYDAREANPCLICREAKFAKCYCEPCKEIDLEEAE